MLRAFADLEPVPWSNGAGSTVELLTLEESSRVSPAFPRWRLSIARLDQPAPFSPLPGMHRSFMPVEGTVDLIVDGERRRVPDRTVSRFIGDSSVELDRLTRPCFAVNLMSESSEGVSLVLAGEHCARIAEAGNRDSRVIASIALSDSGSRRKFDVIVNGHDPISGRRGRSSTQESAAEQSELPPPS